MTPSQVLQEDSALLFRIMEMRKYASAYSAIMSPDATEQNTTQAQRDLVFPVVDAIAKGHLGAVDSVLAASSLSIPVEDRRPLKAW